MENIIKHARLFRKFAYKPELRATKSVYVSFTMIYEKKPFYYVNFIVCWLITLQSQSISK